MSEDIVAYASQIQRQICGVWLNAKVRCPSCKSIISTGVFSHFSHIWIETWCPNCQKTTLMRVIEIEPDPDANKKTTPLMEEE